jgi:hypothetical protein
MDEAEIFARDRSRYRLHAATFLIGVGGWAATVASAGFLVPAARGWLLVGFAAVLTFSGVLAIVVKRTLFSKHVSESHTDSDGDALMTASVHTDLSPFVTNAVAPYAVLAVGVILLVFSATWGRTG